MKQRAFTLVELSIVLVILGLLIGGVLTGQSLIRAAELRSVSTQYQRYVTAVQTFRDKYFALPGDMTNAQSYWGVATNCPGTSAQGSTDAKTCYGNGDGLVFNQTGSDEPFRFWQHLANAGLIEGSYSGVTSDPGGYALATTTANAPSGRISSSLWYVNYMDNSTGSLAGIYVYTNMRNTMMFGGTMTTDKPWGSILTPTDAYNIDTKLDDGKPLTGKVMSKAIAACSGVADGSAANIPTAAYALSGSALACFLYFPDAF